MNSRLTLPLLTIAAILQVAAMPAADGPQEGRDALKMQVERLIVALDAPTRKERMTAERELSRLGPDVLPFLPPPELLNSITVRESVRRVRVALEREMAIESIRPSEVTLQGDFPLSEVLREIAAQTGNPIHADDLPEATLKQNLAVEFDKRHFWPALDDVIGRAGLEYNSEGDADRVGLVKRRETTVSDAAVHYSGAFRIAVSDAALRPFPDSGPFRIVRVNYRLSAEPRLRPLFTKYLGSDFRAVAADGTDLPPFTPDAKPEIPLGEGGRHLKLYTDFRVPAESVPQAISFHGKLSLTVAAGAEQIEFTKLKAATGAARRRGGVTVRLQKVDLAAPAQEGRTARIHVVVAYDVGGPAFESHRSWIFHNLVYLQTADGTRIERDGLFHTNLQADGAVVVEYGFRDLRGDLDDYKFVYVAPTLLVNLPVEFDFRKIPVSPSTSERKQP